MVNCVEDYQQTDQHPIASVKGEPCEALSAYSLHAHMAEYYVFLQTANVYNR